MARSILLLLVGLVAAATATAAATAAATTTAPTIVPQYGKFEACVTTLPFTVTNPFNYSEAMVQGTFTGPNGGAAVTVDGFYAVPYTRSLVNNEEQLTQTASPQWCVRFAPSVMGTFQYTLTAWTVHTKNQQYHLAQGSFLCNGTGPQPSGFVTVARNNQYFETDAGTTYFPIGENVAWSNASGTFAYDHYFQRIAAHGGNYARVWLTDGQVLMHDLLATETKLGQVNLENAWRVDYIVELAQSLDMRLLMATESFNLLCINTTPYCSWNQSYYNVANGGILNTPSEFFTSEAMQEFYRQRLRYMIARWSWATSMFAIEFFNEVDLVQGFDVDVAATWMQDMGTWIQSLDRFNHMISNSFSYPLGRPEIDKLDVISFTMTHTYGAKDMVGNTATFDQFKGQYGKPTYIAEFGNGNGYKPNQPAGMDDPTGIYMNNGFWGATASIGAGTPMTWWWDSYVDPARQYWRFSAVSSFVKLVDWVNYQWSKATASTSSADVSVHAQVGPGDASGQRPQLYVALFHNTNYTWYNVANKAPCNPVTITATLSGCNAYETYKVTLYNTTSGMAFPWHNADCSDENQLSFQVHNITSTIAAIVHVAGAME